MNLSCVICAELLSSTDDVHVTLCGHLFHQVCLMQWLERSKTCPQCRNKCYQKSHHKIYFNIANLDISSIDIGSLQQQLEDVKLQNQIKTKEEDKLKKQIDELKSTRKKCMETINGLETKLESNKFALTQFSEQIKILKSETKILDAQRKEIAELKRQIELMETVQTLISSTSAEVEKLLEQDSKPQSLATWVVILKKELKACELKKAEIRNTLKSVQHELRKIQEVKRNLENKISVLESENFQLNSKVDVLEKKSNEINFSPRNSRNNIDNSPTCKCKKKSQRNNNLDNVIDLSDNYSPGIPLKVKQIEDSDSPYLSIKSSSLGLKPILKVADRVRNNIKNLDNVKSSLKPESIFETRSNFGVLRKNFSEDSSDKYSIFKRPRLTEQNSNRNDSSMVFNGFGGSERRLSSPTKLLSLNEEAKSKLNNINNRLKAGKLRKIPSSTQLIGLDNGIEKFIKKS